MTEKLQFRRARFGFSSFQISTSLLDAFALIVARLAGKEKNQNLCDPHSYAATIESINGENDPETIGTSRRNNPYGTNSSMESQ
jgi:hypothetical protein